MTQVDVLEEYQMLLVLANKTLYVFPLEALESSDNLLKRPKKIQGHASFFKSGVCMGRHLVCAAKMSGISTTIKVYEPTESNLKNKKKPGLPKMFQGAGESLRPFKVGICVCMIFSPSANVDLTGVLRSCGIHVHRLLAVQTMCSLYSGFRGGQLGDTGDAAITG